MSAVLDSPHADRTPPSLMKSAFWRRIRTRSRSAEPVQPVGAPEVRLPEAEPIRWWPMIFSVFGLLIPNGLLLRGDATPGEWLLAALGAAAFVVLSGVAVVSWQRNRPFLWVVVLLVALGFAYTPMTFAGAIFYGLAAHMLPWAVGGSVPRAAAYGTLLVAVVLGGYWVIPEHSIRWINISIYFVLTLIGQVWIVRLCLNLRRLAEGAERQRIADELHDTLGWALLKITLKAQVARRLLEEAGDCEQARVEVADTEAICREALAEVRQTVRAYREESRKEQGRANAG
jgi:signal transduction histidine kinase